MVVVAPGVAAKMVGVATATITTGVTAAVVEARQGRRALVVAHDAAKGATLMHVSWEQVSRALAEGASGPESFTLLLRLVMAHFDRVDTQEVYTK